MLVDLDNNYRRMRRILAMMMMKIKMAITWPIYKIAASSYLFCIVVDLDNNCVHSATLQGLV